MELLALIILGILIFVLMGLCGWLLKLFDGVFQFLAEGFWRSCSCLVWIFLIFCFLIVLLL
jgi:hypothetical protein